MTSFSEKYARRRVREERTSIAMCRSLGRSLRIGQRTVSISITSLTEHLEPRFTTEWNPSPPPRLLPGEIALFDAFRLRAMAELRAELEADRR